jgi:hypothetical protein
MDLIIKNDSFNIQQIGMKRKTNQSRSNKLIYRLGFVSIIGIPLEIKDYIIVNQSKNFLYIDIDKLSNKVILNSIDAYFQEKYSNYHPFIDDSILKIKKHNDTTINENDPLFISINNIKIKDKKLKIQIFTI